MSNQSKCNKMVYPKESNRKKSTNGKPKTSNFNGGRNDISKKDAAEYIAMDIEHLVKMAKTTDLMRTKFLNCESPNSSCMSS